MAHRRGLLIEIERFPLILRNSSPMCVADGKVVNGFTVAILCGFFDQCTAVLALRRGPSPKS
jgi:hypothetical protein